METVHKNGCDVSFWEDLKEKIMTTPKRLVDKSKYLSLVLRHRPDKIGIELEKDGWVEVELLLEGMKGKNRGLSRQDLETIVATDEKQRYSFSPDGLTIRANQGHSVSLDMEFEKLDPPDELYHGTADRNRESILKSGLEKRNRHHVHLSADVKTAVTVGQRHGNPIVFVIDARAMAAAGYEFFRSANGVWLVSEVPPEFLAEHGK